MTRHSLGAGAVLAVVLLGWVGVGPAAQTPTASPGDLTAFFGANGFVRDSNGDAINDFVAARIIVPASPSLEDSTAAVNLAARLGFETTSLTLPLVLRDDALANPTALDAPIIVGRTNRLVQTLADRGGAVAPRLEG